MSEPRRRKRPSQWPFAPETAQHQEQQPPADQPRGDDDLLAAEDAVVADASEMPALRRDERFRINPDLLSDELDGPLVLSRPSPPGHKPGWLNATPDNPHPDPTPVTPSTPTGAPAPAQTDQPAPAPQAAAPASPSAVTQPSPQPPVTAPAPAQPISAAHEPASASVPVAAEPAPAHEQPPGADLPSAPASGADAGGDIDSLLLELDDDTAEIFDLPDEDLLAAAPVSDDTPAESAPVSTPEEPEVVEVTTVDPAEEAALVPVIQSEPEMDTGGPLWSGIPIASKPSDTSAPPPNFDVGESDLAVDEEFWASLGADDDSDEDLVAPVFNAPDGDDGSGLRSLLRRRDEPAPIDAGLLDRLSRQRRRGVSAADAAVDEEFVPVDAPAPLGLDEDHDEDAPPEEWRPPIYVAARQAAFAGPQTLSLISPNLKSDVDELNDALAAFSELQPGQKGFIRASIRAYPEFKAVSTAWQQQRKVGIDPDAEKPGAGKTIFNWLGWSLRRLWFEANKSSAHLGGSVPPLRPGQAGDTKPLPQNVRSEEERAAERDASQKARDSHHFETVLRVGVVTKNDDAAEAERIADEVAAGFEIYATEHQFIVWGATDPYDTCIGYMGTKRPDRVGLSLSAAELGELARVPDDLTRPHGVRIRHSSFKQLMPGNRILIDDPYEPPPGVIPLGVLSPRSEDAQVIGIRNAELDRHMFFCGRTGTGKSEMMKWLIFGVAKADYPLVVIDPHGALVDDLVNTLIVNCPERVSDIVVADLGDPDHPVALNPLDIHKHDQIEPTVGAVMEMLAQHMSLGQGNAPRASNYAHTALTALTEANLHLSDPDTKTTLLHVVRFFQDEEFRRLIMAFCTNPASLEMYDPETGPFEQMPEKTRVGELGAVIRAFQQLSRSESFNAVFSSGENRLDFASLIMGKKIVLIKLARFAHQKKLGEFIGALVIPYLLASMDDWGRKKDPITGQTVGRGCRIFVDEAPTLIGPDSAAIQLLAEARKWDFGMVFASQYLSQFDQSVMKATLANTATKVTLALDPDNTTQISKAISGTSGLIGPNDVAALPDYHMYANVLLPTADGGKATSGVFSAACLRPINCDLTDDHVAIRQQVLERSWTLICNNRDDIRRKQKTMVEDIKATLLTKLQERLEASDDPLAGHDPGQQDVDYGIDLDGDDFTNW